MTIRYRKLDENGDIMGRGELDFLYDTEAVAQACQTRLLLFNGYFWRDTSDGIDMFNQVMGYNNTAIADGLIQNRIATTQDVVGIVNYTSFFDRPARKYTFTARIQTAYSQTQISGVI